MLCAKVTALIWLYGLCRLVVVGRLALVPVPLPQILVEFFGCHELWLGRCRRSLVPTYLLFFYVFVDSCVTLYVHTA